jgi:hypothetical protein
VEIGLTLYDAIWHPHDLDWPLRGLPERILLPGPLAQHDLSDICAAASWMHASVDSMSDAAVKKKLTGLPFIKGTIRTLQKQYTPARLPGRRRAPRQQMTVAEAQHALRVWLRAYGFTQDHRVERVPKGLRDQGYALPGWETPAAGYLLPVVAPAVSTIRDGVTYNGVRYQHPASAIEPGYVVPLRAMPQGTRPQAVFAAYGDPPGLRYLEFAGRIVHMAAG